MSQLKTEPIIWQAQLLRFTAFTNMNFESMLQQWWSTVVEEDPDKIDVQPKLKLSIYQSAFNSGRLLLQVQPGRIDWVYIAEDSAPTEFPTLGVYSSVMPLFKNTISKWMRVNEVPELSRLAYGAVLVSPVSSKKEAYLQLAQFMPTVNIDTDNSTDFFYQINRPRTVNDVKINRLSKWSAVTAMLLPLNQIKIASQLELDINTSPDRTDSITVQEFNSLLETLIELGDEIAHEGDIP
jgi:hypothetical protein